MTRISKNGAFLATAIIALGVGTRSPATAEPIEFGHWSFDECSEMGVHDSSPYGNDGTISSEVMWASPGYDGLGCALQFDGYQGNTYVTVPHSESLNFNGSLFLSAWINHEYSGNTLDPIITKGNSSVPYAFYVNDRGLQFLANYNTGGTQFTVNTSPDLFEHGEWIHVAAYYDQEYVRLYSSEPGDMEGTLILRKEELVNYPIVNNDQALYFGLDIPGFTERYKGMMDEVVIAIPEPATLSLLALGGLVMIRRQWRM